MYNCTFTTTSGDSFYFGYDYGTIFDLDPISELDVTVDTSQGFQQIGTIVEAETVSGVSREIKGDFLDYTNTSLVKSMLSIFTPGTHGKLYFNDDYYCDCVVQKTPAIAYSLHNRVRTFSLMLYCPYPYWIESAESVYMLGGYVSSFELPVCYDEHTFATKSELTYANCINTGMVEVPFSVQFTCDATVEGYGVENVNTDEFLKLDDTLEVGETVNIYREEGRLKIEKTAGNEVTDIFSALTEDSTLFSVDVGDNFIEFFADSGSENLTVYITINPASTGVIAE